MSGSILKFLSTYVLAFGLSMEVFGGRIATYYKTIEGEFMDGFGTIDPPQVLTPTPAEGAAFAATLGEGQKIEGWWYYSASPISGGGEPVDELGATNPITIHVLTAEDKWLVAHFANITYTLKYLRDGGMHSTAVHPYEETFEIAAISDAPMGYHYPSVWTNADGVVFAPSDLVSGRDFGLQDRHDDAAVVILNVDKIPNTYKVEYDLADGAWGADALHPASATYDEEFLVMDPVRRGYDFNGWYKKTGGGSMVRDKDAGTTTCKNLTAENGGSVKLTAQWKPLTTYVTFNSHGATTSGTTELYVDFGSTPRSISVPSLQDRTFDGYWTEEFDGERLWDAQGQWRGGVWDFDEKEFEVHAHWLVDTLTIRFDGNGATNSDAMADAEIEINGDRPLLHNRYVRPGYTFVGWTNVHETIVTPDCELAKNLLKGLSTKKGQTYTFYAKWQPITYYLGFDPNGAGKPRPESPVNGKDLEPLAFTYDDPPVALEAKFGSPLVYDPYEASFWKLVGWSNTWNDVVYTNNMLVANAYDVANETNALVAVLESRNSALSQAMHCDNLLWTCDGGDDAWVKGDEGYAGSDSCARVPPPGTDFRTSVATNGLLRFRWRSSVTDAQIAVVVSSPYHPQIDIMLTAQVAGEWSLAEITNEWGAVEITLRTHMGGPDDAIIDIDQMTWEQEGYTLHFDANGGEGAPADLAIPLGNGARIPKTAPTLEGSVFNGWTTNAADRTSVDFRPGAWYEMPDAEKDSTNTLYAVWSEAPIAVPVPTAVPNLYYDGTVKTGVAKGEHYSVINNTATAIGDYEAQVTLEDGNFVWAGKDKAERKLWIPWSIVLPPPVTNDVPVAVSGLVYDGNVKTGVVASAGCTISGNVATDAGEYVAVAKLDRNHVWPDGSSSSTNIAWSIARGTKDVSGVTFPSLTVKYDGAPHAIGIVGELPEGVTAIYQGETNRTEVGTNVVTVSFAVADPKNWNEITDTLTATLVVERLPPPSAHGDLYDKDKIGEFTGAAAATYYGWLRDPVTSNIVATLQVKTAVAKGNGLSKTTISVTPVGGKKKTYKGTVFPGLYPQDEYGIVYGALALTGEASGFEGLSDKLIVEAAKDFTKAKDPEEERRAERIPQGCRTLALVTEQACYDCLSVTVSAKGKATVKGSFSDGTSLSLTAQGAVGEDAFAIPISFSKNIKFKTGTVKENVTFAFVIWIAGDEMWLTDLNAERWTDPSQQILGVGELENPEDGKRKVSFLMPTWEDYLSSVDGFDVSPLDERVRVEGKKWSTDKTVGSVKVDRATGVAYVQCPADKAPANLSKLKFTYTEKTGLAKGSLKLYYVVDGKLKTESVAVSGVVVNGAFYGNATAKKKGTTPIWWE